VILQLLQRDKLKFSWTAFPVYRAVYDGGCNQRARYLKIIGSAESVGHARRHRIRDLKKARQATRRRNEKNLQRVET
jgi:hypothetical protein